MRWIIFGLTLLMAPTAMAQTIICARDFAADGFDLCEKSGQPRYVYVVGADEQRAVVCVATYPDTNCKNLKREFGHAVTSDGEIVCVLNFNQPETGNYCAADPKRYAYIKDPWAE